MSELFSVFKQNLVWSLMLWVVFFTIFAALFAGRRLTPFAHGVVRVLIGIITSPFVFIRRAVRGVLQFGEEQENAYRASNQYLLSKAVTVLQAMVIVGAIGLLAAGAIATWRALVPSAEIRREAREYRVAVQEQRTKAKTAADAVTKLDREWMQMQTAAVARFRKARIERRARATREMTSVENDVANYGGDAVKATLAEMKRKATPPLQSREEAPSRRQELDATLSRTWWLASWERSHLDRWNTWWELKAVAEQEIANVPMDEVRAGEQSAHAEAKATDERESATLTSMEERSKQLDELASLKWKAAGWSVLAGFIAFLTFVWLWGALVEAGWLVLRVADDIRRMREAAVPEPAAVEGSRLPVARGTSVHAGSLVSSSAGAQ
jgi:hypothetical protein